MRKSPKKVNMSIFPVGYPEAIYKEIVNNSVQDPLQLTKIALYQIQDAELSSRNEIATTCVGIIVESSSEPISEHFQYKSFKSPSWIILGASGVVLLIMIRKGEE